MVNKYCLIIVLTCNVFIAFCGTNQNADSYEAFLKAEYEFLNNNLDKAEKYYYKAYKIHPNSTTIIQSLADLKLYQGEYTQAINLLEKIMELEPNNKKTGIILSKILYERGSHTKSRSIIDALLIHHPEDIDILFAKSDIQYFDQDWNDLINTYYKIYNIDNRQEELIIKMYEIGVATNNQDQIYKIFKQLINTSNFDIITELLIIIEEERGNLVEAIELTKNIIYERGQDLNTLIRLSELYLKNRNYEEVINILFPIFQDGNNSFEVLKMLLISFSILEKNEEEIIISKRIINSYPDLKIGYEALSYSYIQLDMKNEAKEVLIHALKIFPNEIIFSFSLANLMSNLGQYLEAEKYYRYSLSLKSDLISVKRAMALMYEEMNDYNRSDSLFLEIIKVNDAIGQNDYAYLLSEREKIGVDELNYALEIAKNALLQEPENAAFLDTIGWIYYKLETYSKAAEFIQKSLKINNNNPVILEHMGDVYVKLDKTGKAKEMYEQVLSIDSDNKLVRNKINRISE